MHACLCVCACMHAYVFVVCCLATKFGKQISSHERGGGVSSAPSVWDYNYFVVCCHPDPLLHPPDTTTPLLARYLLITTYIMCECLYTVYMYVCVCVCVRVHVRTVCLCIWPDSCLRLITCFPLWWSLLHASTVNSHLTDALNSGHTQYNGQCMMYQLKLIYFMYLRNPWIADIPQLRTTDTVPAPKCIFMYKILSK